MADEVDQTADTIIAKLNEVFAPMDERVLAESKEWAKGRAQAIRDFRTSDEYKAIRRDASALYTKLHTIAGGKTWYNVFNGNSAAIIEAFVTKNCAAIAEKRNANIAKKLEKTGVTEVVSEEFHHTNDGFNGLFVVNTNAGRKSVHIETIYAGGYNVQCLHLRVLVKVK